MDKSTILTIIFTLVVVLYIYKTVSMYRTIQKSIVLSDRGKLIHSTMVWLVPFAWYAIFKGIIEHKSETMTKSKRAKLNKGKGSFYESGKGMHG
ncbi:MAG: hypothetical protein JEZ01_06025 [Labilibaculum sp.]|nr:hypothetical protein [Labilibaculum sp.]MBI9057311.1 hypothetical protein [Labilibaculum sp.]